MTEEELIKKYIPESKQKKALEKLKNNYPVQYLIGNVEFLNCIIDVNENVLIPRFETELLVDKTIKYIKQLFENKSIEIADLCTGSGAIAIALKKNLDCNIDAYEISKKAIEVAKNNAKKNNANINIYEHNCLTKINKTYDIIISNPPYLTEKEPIAPAVKYEPSLALYANNEGLEFYESILKYLPECIKDKHLIAFEYGLNQEEHIKKIAKTYFPKDKIIIEKDLNDINRYIFIIHE